jgi:UDP:flavonoid glycosyltransferase YjiC (YdhE family)
MDVKTILFGVVGWNIAETTRMIEIAKALPQGFRGEFLSYGGQFEHLVIEAGFTLHRMEPQEGPEKIDLLWRIDRGETYAQPFTLEELRERIRGEEELLSKLRPRAVVMGSVLTFPLSVRLAGLPLINVIPFALSREYFANGLPAAPGKPRWINALFQWFAQKVPILTKNFNAAARELGLPKFDSLLSLWEGDINLLTELPQTFPQVQLPPNWQFVGPIFAHLESPIPQEVEDLLQSPGDPILYFAMGSSANRKVLQSILPLFQGLPVRVIAPVQDHLKGYSGTLPDNVLVTSWLPAHRINPRCAAAVIHGGQGTVQTACAAGIPFLGIGMQPEQSINIQSVVDFGAALRMRRGKIKKKIFQKMVMELLESPRYRAKAQELAELTRSYDGAQRAADFLQEYLAVDRPLIPKTPYTQRIDPQMLKITR